MVFSQFESRALHTEREDSFDDFPAQKTFTVPKQPIQFGPQVLTSLTFILNLALIPTISRNTPNYQLPHIQIDSLLYSYRSIA